MSRPLHPPIVLAILALVVLLPGLVVSRGRPLEVAQSLRTVRMTIGERVYTLEVADDDISRQTGLMHRKEMPEHRGMIFVFPDEQIRAFWMKNTHIPLDILYLDRRGRVISIHQMTPHDERMTVSHGPAKYAIELLQGQVAEAGVRVGDVLEIPLDALKASEER